TQVTFSATGVTFIGTSRSVTVTATYFGSTRAASLTVVGQEKVEKELAIAKEIETEFRARQSTGVERTEAPEERSGESTEEGEQSTAEEPEGSASGRAFVQPAERDLPGQEALDQPPAQKEEKAEKKEEKTRARRGRKKKRPEG
ncbi:MAG TPA: hypothetical protein VHM69_04175, partial [Rubrobacter sp.]|nr:hypothetical protein [Rubrobacter sp.]